MDEKNSKGNDLEGVKVLDLWIYYSVAVLGLLSILELGNKFAIRKSHCFPKMVNWESKDMALDKEEVIQLFSKNVEKLVQTLEEWEYTTQISREDTPPPYPPDEAHSVPTLKSIPPSASMIPSVSMPLSKSIPNTSEAQKPICSAILAKLESVEREQIALKQGQIAILKGQTKIMGCLKALMTLMED
uniref:Uncharacterized protein n=1 Tax=Cannabis sativa TaxID=3483 RepID=A0A803Q0A2_CANSA